MTKQFEEIIARLGVTSQKLHAVSKVRRWDQPVARALFFRCATWPLFPYNRNMDRFADRMLADMPLLVIDTETTGLFPWLGHRIVEVGAVRLENWQVTAQLDELVQPGRKMDPKASAVNGIYDEDLLGKPTFAQIAGKLVEMAEGAILVAHNASFDAGFLGMEATIAGEIQRLECGNSFLENPWLCTLQLARRNFYFGRNNLGNIARHLGVSVGRAHRALNDVHTTAKVLEAMVHLLCKQRLRSVGDLLNAQGGAIFTPIQPSVHMPSIFASALANGAPLRIRYATSSGESERVIEPLYSSEHHGNKYLIAFCHLRREQRTFRFDRILGAEPLGER
jgi:DNA polymerase-3 subunit epsilon